MISIFSWLGLLEASVVGGIGIVLFFSVSLLFGERYRASYLKVIWLLIALRMCIPISISLFPKPLTVQVPVYVLQENGQMTDTDNALPGGTKPEEESQAITASAAGNEDKSGYMANRTAIHRQFTSQDFLVILWSLGSVAVLLFHILAHFLFCRKMFHKSKKCTDESILKTVATAAGEMGLKNVPQVRLTKDTQMGPFTVGFFRNTVFLPDTDYQERNLQYIVRHELAHCAGKDTQIKVLFVIVNAIHWFNPFAWLMKSLVAQDMELACDEKVLTGTSKEERSEYGEVLMSCIGTDISGGSVLSAGYVQGVKFIKKRFRNIFNMRKKSGKVAGGIMIVLLIMVSAGIGLEEGRTVYAKSGIAIEHGIELRTDVTGDGLPDQVIVSDDYDLRRTRVALHSADGRSTYFDYYENFGADSYLVSGDLSGNGAADIVLIRGGFGMHSTGRVSVFYAAEGSGMLEWEQYPEVFIPNPAIDMEQPETLKNIACLDATIIEEGGRQYLRLIAMDMEYFLESGGDDDQVLYIDCSWQGDGWFIEKIEKSKGMRENEKTI